MFEMNRRRVSQLVLAAITLLFSAVAWATYSNFPGNGRGGPVASRFTCNDTNRGRTWDLYGAPNDGTKSDVLQICLYSTAGAGTYVFKGVDTTAGGT
jgi:hypothetical protein